MVLPPWEVLRKSSLPVVAQFEAVVDDRLHFFDVKMKTRMRSRAQAKRLVTELVRQEFAQVADQPDGGATSDISIVTRIGIRGWVLKDGTVRWMADILAGDGEDLAIASAPSVNIARFARVLVAELA